MKGQDAPRTAEHAHRCFKITETDIYKVLSEPHTHSIVQTAISQHHTYREAERHQQQAQCLPTGDQQRLYSTVPGSISKHTVPCYQSAIRVTPQHTGFPETVRLR